MCSGRPWFLVFVLIFVSLFFCRFFVYCFYCYCSTRNLHLSSQLQLYINCNCHIYIMIMIMIATPTPTHHVGGWGSPVGCFPPCGVSPRGVWGLCPLRFLCRAWLLPFCDVSGSRRLWRPRAWPASRPPTWLRRLACCCRAVQQAVRSWTSNLTSW